MSKISSVLNFSIETAQKAYVRSASADVDQRLLYAAKGKGSVNEEKYVTIVLIGASGSVQNPSLVTLCLFGASTFLVTIATLPKYFQTVSFIFSYFL